MLAHQNRFPEKGPMSDPLMFEFTVQSQAGAHMVASIGARFGPALASMTRHMQRLFLLRSGSAPGLHFAGGETVSGPETAGPTFSVGGAGITAEDAIASCLGEGAERLSQIEQDGDVACRALITDVQDRLLPDALELIAHVCEAGKVAWDRTAEAEWMEAADLLTGRHVLVPADWCIRRQVAGALTMPGTALSTGVAAGPTIEAAAARALLELVERDAVGLWWLGGRRGRSLSLDDAAVQDASALISAARAGATTRRTWLLDLTTDIAIPCVAALSSGASGRDIASGFAARSSTRAAARAAVVEMCQMELANDIVDLKRRQRGDSALNDADRRILTRMSGLDAATGLLLHPTGTPAPSEAQPDTAGSDGAELALIQACFARAAIGAALVDLTRDRYGVPVVCAIAPSLQRLPSDIRTSRLLKIAPPTLEIEFPIDGISIL